MIVTTFKRRFNAGTPHKTILDVQSHFGFCATNFSEQFDNIYCFKNADYVTKKDAVFTFIKGDNAQESNLLWNMLNIDGVDPGFDLLDSLPAGRYQIASLVTWKKVEENDEEI